MLVLHRIHPARRHVQWREANGDVADRSELAAVQRALLALGTRRFEVWEHLENNGVDHEWDVESGRILYTMSADRAAFAPGDFAFYVAALLATCPQATNEELLSVHLALYELYTNAFEHGRPIPEAEERVRLVLELDSDKIIGRFSDDCMEFDMVGAGPVDVGARANDRELRGYGVTLIHRALDRVAHDFGPRGNTITFEKRLLSCPNI